MSGLVRTSALLNRSDDSRYPFLIPVLDGNIFNISILNEIIVWFLHTCALTFQACFEFLLWKGVKFYLMLFLAIN